MQIGVRPDDQTKLYEEIEKLTGWEREQTNKEWIQSATTEQLAGAIYEWYSLGYTRGKNGKKLNPITEVVEWLKEKHHDSVQG